MGDTIERDGDHNSASKHVYAGRRSRDVREAWYLKRLSTEVSRACEAFLEGRGMRAKRGWKRDAE